jgi:hypothetical protein
MGISVLALTAFAFGMSAFAAEPNWDVSGSYVADMELNGSQYPHDMVLAQDSEGDLTGHGGSPVGANTYTWVIADGEVDGNTINFTAHYTATADAVTPLTVMLVTGIVDTDGSMSGTWSDNYQGGARAGTWETTTGTADLIGTLAAEDFGVVDYATGLGTLAGYNAGFGLTDATFENAQSVVVKLYAGDTLLQTNTATSKLGEDITGTQISSPFDVSGDFDYVTDGYWVNVREAQYGQSVPATRVVATVTLESGKVVTAENTILSGDPTTIYPDVVVPPTPITPTTKDQCKNEGWKTFTSPAFKNQGQCVKFINQI